MATSEHSSEREKSDVQKMLAWALTERLEGSPRDKEIDLPQFTILGVLGQGGMGTVYKAEHKEDGRRVALKIFSGSGRERDLLIERLKREGRLLEKLEHPNVLGIHDGGVMVDGTPYLVLEYVEGGDLQKRLYDAKRLNVKEAIRIAVKVCNGLSAAHGSGVIHRDVKPANILLGDDGSVKISDFGVSKEALNDQDTSLTMTGTTIGTVDYMSPEQSNGGVVDERSDIYSVGVLLYEMIAGVTPRGAFEPLSKYGAPKELEKLVMRCLQREPMRRPASAASVAAQLKKIYQKLRKKRVQDKSSAYYALFAGLAAFAVLAMLMMRFVRERSQERLESASTAESDTLMESEDSIKSGVPESKTMQRGALTKGLREVDLVSKGKWWITKDAIVCQASPHATLQFPQQPSGNYQLECSFTRVTGNGNIVLFFPSSLGMLDMTMGEKGMFIPALAEGGSEGATVRWKVGRQYHVRIAVTQEHVRGFLDGVLLCTWDLKQSRSSYSPPRVNSVQEGAITLGVDQSQVIFKQVHIRK